MITARSIATALGAGSRGDAQRATLFTLLTLLVVAAWAMLWLWSASPYGRYLGHDAWADDGAFAALCRAVPLGESWLPAALHAAAWVLMIAAMMLPTTFPLLSMFRRITRDRADAGRLVALVLGGFFAAWLAFGLIAHAADETLRWGAGREPWFVANGWMIGAAVLAGAGLFQWSALKYRCLEQCHTPFAFVAARWHGRAPVREAFRLGLDHGVFCVGCCWALMMLMFVVGMGNLGWMLLLAAVMAAEKNLPWGRRLRTPLGVGLIAWAGAIVIAHV
jgi:predicted metal-binding membrane protein